MPSFRLELEILGLRPGHAPPEVLDALLGHFHHQGLHVDAHDLDVVGGTPRLYVRFVVAESNDAEEDATAFTIADAARKATDAVAVPGRLWVLRRRKGAWLPARWHHRSPIEDDVRFDDADSDDVGSDDPGGHDTDGSDTRGHDPGGHETDGEGPA